MKGRIVVFLLVLALVPAGGHAQGQEQEPGGIAGIVVSAGEDEFLPGVTIVVTGHAPNRNWNAISDKYGRFHFGNLPEGPYSILFVYGDSKARMNLEVLPGHVTTLYPKLDLSVMDGGGCNFCGGRPLIASQETQTRTEIDSVVMARIPLAARYARRGSTLANSQAEEGSYVVQGVSRSGMPHLAYIHDEFIEYVEFTGATARSQAGDSLGRVREVIIRGGWNDLGGSVLGQMRQSSAVKSMQIATTLHGPIEPDKAWFFLGAVSEMSGGSPAARIPSTTNHQWLSRVDYSPALEHAASLLYVGTADGKALVDDLGARWTSSFFDAHGTLQATGGLHFGASNSVRDEQQNGRLEWTQKFEALGYHELSAGIGVEKIASKKLDESHGNSSQVLKRSAYLLDGWFVVPNVYLNAGMRYESLVEDDDAQVRHVWSPRVGIAYDWTKEGRSKAFASLARVHSSSGAPPGRLPALPSKFAGVIGAEYELAEELAVGTDYQGRWSENSDTREDAVAIRLRHIPGYCSNQVFVQASYTYAKSRGQRFSPRPDSNGLHFDGYYTYTLREDRKLTGGLSLRAALGAAEQFDANFRLRYERKTDEQTLEVFADILALETSEPVGVYAKSEPVSRLASAGGTSSRRAGPSIRLGVRYSY